MSKNTSERIERVLGGLPNAQPAAIDALLKIMNDECEKRHKHLIKLLREGLNLPAQWDDWFARVRAALGKDGK